MYGLIVEQWDMLLISLLLGVFMGCTYDLLRFLRRIIKHGTLAIAIQDAVYWLLWTITVIYVIQRRNAGVLQAYIFIGIMIGVTAYLFISCFLNKMLKNIKKRVKIKLTIARKRDSGDRYEQNH